MKSNPLKKLLLYFFPYFTPLFTALGLINFLILFSFILSFSFSAYANEANIANINDKNEKPVMHWKSADVDITDLPSLQRGFKLFMNHCSGCHSLKYVRYNTVAQDIGIVGPNGIVLTQAVKDNLLFVGDKITDNILTSMQKSEGNQWFGIAPPDLSLVTRSRGADWVYNYLLSFYPDNKKIWGVNNTVYPDVAMPHVLEKMQKSMTPEEYEKSVHDIVNFLNYVGEPMQLKRKHIGAWVLVFLGILTIFAFLLKREYWKDIK